MMDLIMHPESLSLTLDGTTYTKMVCHHARFHADDVFSAALILFAAAYQNFKANCDGLDDDDRRMCYEHLFVTPPRSCSKWLMPIERLPFSEIESAQTSGSLKNALIFDIGNGKYDHHLVPRETRPNGIAYAAFGKLWRDIAPIIGFQPVIINYFDRSFAAPIDLGDNSGMANGLGFFIACFNAPNSTSPEQAEAFDTAVYSAYRILGRELRYLKGLQSSYFKNRIVPTICTSKRGNTFYITPRPVKPQLMACEYPGAAVIFEHPRGGYCIQALQDFNANALPISRWEPNTELWGKPKQVLSQMVPGLTFCHATGFLMNFEDYQSAYNYAMENV